MSIHRSLVAKGRLRRHRNVLSRAERLERLREQGRWKEGDSIYHLPKVGNIMPKAKAKKKAAKQAAEPTPTEEAAESSP